MPVIEESVCWQQQSSLNISDTSVVDKMGNLFLNRMIFVWSSVWLDLMQRDSYLKIYFI